MSQAESKRVTIRRPKNGQDRSEGVGSRRECGAHRPPGQDRTVVRGLPSRSSHSSAVDVYQRPPSPRCLLYTSDAADDM
eukprot:13462777-Alexandrium_andersonii.AAC.1